MMWRWMGLDVNQRVSCTQLLTARSSAPLRLCVKCLYRAAKHCLVV